MADRKFAVLMTIPTAPGGALVHAQQTACQRTGDVKISGDNVRLTLINGNTSATITDLVVRYAREAAAPDTEITGFSARFGVPYIASRAGYAIASHAVLDAYAAYASNADAIVIACFGDPGIDAVREVASVPVVGMAEAGCRAAAAQGRFSIVTGGERWIAMLTEYVGVLGLADRFVGVRAVAPTGAQIAADPQGSAAVLAQACRAAVEEDGAEIVVLGGAGLAGLSPRIAANVKAPLIDGLEAAITAAEKAVRQASSTRAPTLADLPSSGLSPELAKLLIANRAAR
jgi:Asp/Glu/hydantoin racemase